MASYQKQVRIYRALRFFLGLPICRILGFRYAPCDPPVSPCLVVANHNTDFDPIFLGAAFKKHMYFVASEHVFRWGFWSKLLVGVFDPIARVKGSTDAAAAMAIIRKLRSGANVCLFAEGNRSFNGITGPIFPATGKLVKSARAALVTYRLRGGYLASPRWSRSLRRGPITGELVQVYTPDMLREMSADEINAAIARDLAEDAFVQQAIAPQEYRGRNLAEHLEYALYLCPGCGRIGTLHSHGDRFFCDCGLSVRYNTRGFFEGEMLRFSDVSEWDLWQEDEMDRIAHDATEAPAFSDGNVQLREIRDGHESVLAAVGTLSISAEALVCGDRRFPLGSITDMALFGATHIAFSTDDGTPYELRADPPCCGRKYLTFFQRVKEKR